MIKELFCQVSMRDSIPPLRNKEFKITKISLEKNQRNTTNSQIKITSVFPAI